MQYIDYMSTPTILFFVISIVLRKRAVSWYVIHMISYDNKPHSNKQTNKQTKTLEVNEPAQWCVVCAIVVGKSDRRRPNFLRKNN